MSGWWGSLWKRAEGGELSPSDEASVPGAFIPPDCPADESEIRFGGICKDAVTGKIKYRDAGGVKELP